MQNRKKPAAEPRISLRVLRMKWHTPTWNEHHLHLSDVNPPGMVRRLQSAWPTKLQPQSEAGMSFSRLSPALHPHVKLAGKEIEKGKARSRSHIMHDIV